MPANQSKQVPLNWPVKGFTEMPDFDQVPPGFTMDCLNVVNFDPLKHRFRGGKRDGTSRVVEEPLTDPGKPVQRLGQITLGSDQFIGGEFFFNDPDWEIPEFGWPDFLFPEPDDPDEGVEGVTEATALTGEVDQQDITLDWELL